MGQFRRAAGEPVDRPFIAGNYGEIKRAPVLPEGGAIGAELVSSKTAIAAVPPVFDGIADHKGASPSIRDTIVPSDICRRINRLSAKLPEKFDMQGAIRRK
jgi:hypothetical protein